MFAEMYRSCARRVEVSKVGKRRFTYFRRCTSLFQATDSLALVVLFVVTATRRHCLESHPKQSANPRIERDAGRHDHPRLEAREQRTQQRGNLCSSAPAVTVELILHPSARCRTTIRMERAGKPPPKRRRGNGSTTVRRGERQHHPRGEEAPPPKSDAGRESTNALKK